MLNIFDLHCPESGLGKNTPPTTETQSGIKKKLFTSSILKQADDRQRLRTTPVVRRGGPESWQSGQVIVISVAIFGTFPFDTAKTRPLRQHSGFIQPGANAWAKLWWQDLHALAEGSEEIRDMMRPNQTIIGILKDEGEKFNRSMSVPYALANWRRRSLRPMSGSWSRRGREISKTCILIYRTNARRLISMNRNVGPGLLRNGRCSRT